MAKQVQTKAYVLHTRQYKNSSLMVDLLTPAHGVVRYIAKGASKTNSPLFGRFTLAMPLMVFAVGSTTLKTITQVDVLANAMSKAYGYHTLCLYTNELILSLRLDEEQSAEVFAAYEKLLSWAANTPLKNKGLRRFELLLSNICGYQLTIDQIPNDVAWVKFSPHNGIVADETGQTCESGILRAFLQGYKMQNQQLCQIDNFMRQVVNHLVAGKELKSRELLLKE